MPFYPSPAEQQVIPSETEGQPALQILEQNKSLSESLLWKILENYYAEAGIAAWEQVPFYVTNNMVIADVYAELTCALLRDLLPTLEIEQPLYLLELASGSGCFSYYYMERLFEKIAYFKELRDLKLCYVMTDFTDANFDAWTRHAKFSAYQKAGKLDFAIFRPETEQTLTLRHQQITLSAETVRNPILAIANYFFDSIRQDLFLARDGGLQEAKITFFRELNNLLPDTPVTLAQLRTFEQFTDVSTAHYPSAKANAILNRYPQQIESTPFIFPIGALDVVENLQHLSGGKLILLSSDKGFTDTDFISNRDKITYTPHGEAFSFHVNYHALQQFFEQERGHFFFTSDPAFMTTLAISGSMSALPEEVCAFPHTQYYFRETVIKTNPILNYIYSFPLLEPTRESDTATVLNSCCSFMETNHCDPRTLYACSGKLMLILKHLDAAQIQRLLSLFERIAHNIFPVAQKPDIWVVLGIFYFYLDQFHEAHHALMQSMALYGKNDSALYYLGLTYEAMQQGAAASACYQELLALNPTCDLGMKGLARLQKPDTSIPANERYALDYFLKAIARDVLSNINMPLKLVRPADKEALKTLPDERAA